MKAVIYTRVARASETGEASDRQLAECERYAAEHGWDVIGRMSDTGVSAYRGRRPNFEVLMKIVDEGSTDVIVTPDMSRLTRNSIELEDVFARCDKAGVRIITADVGMDTASDNGRFLARVIASLGETESARRSEAIKAGKRAAKTGRLLGLVADYESETQAKRASTQEGRKAQIAEMVCDWPLLTDEERSELAAFLAEEERNRGPVAEPRAAESD